MNILVLGFLIVRDHPTPPYYPSSHARELMHLREPAERRVGEASLWWCAMVCTPMLFEIEKTEESENMNWTTELMSSLVTSPSRNLF